MKVFAFVAPGLEEVECLAVVDVLRRCKIDVTMVSITDDLLVVGSHNIRIVTDAVISEIDWSKADCLFLPGGLPGTTNLGACKLLCHKLIEFAKEGKYISAICAAPSVLGQLGILNGKKATCYPGWEHTLVGAQCQKEGVVVDGTVITARGLGYALDLGLELSALFTNRETADNMKKAIQYADERK